MELSGAKRRGVEQWSQERSGAEQQSGAEWNGVEQVEQSRMELSGAKRRGVEQRSQERSSNLPGTQAYMYTKCHRSLASWASFNSSTVYSRSHELIIGVLENAGLEND